MQLANQRVRRVLIDNWSSVNLLFRSTLEKMGLSVTELKATSVMLYEFSGEGSVAIGTIELVITLGEGPRTVSKLLEFVVIDCPAVYNAILGRPTLIAFEAITSIRHLALKFPSSTGICTI